MDPLRIAQIVLALVGAWALVELALMFKRARTTVESLDRTVSDVNDVVEEARPVIVKLDAALDAVAPALEQIDPLLKQGTVAVEALSADLLEINGVLRDVSAVTGTVSSASSSVSGIAQAASDKVQGFFAKRHHEDAKSLSHPASDDACQGDVACGDDETAEENDASRYFVYGDDQSVAAEGEQSHE